MHRLQAGCPRSGHAAGQGGQPCSQPASQRAASQLKRPDGLASQIDSLRSVESFTSLLKKSLHTDLTLRTSVGAVFDPQDGRRQVYRDPQPRIGGDDKRVDHLYAALDNWCKVAPEVAKSILAMCAAIEKKYVQKLECACEATMKELLKLELLGRTFADSSAPLEERACCYHGKFMMDTVYALVIATMCQSVAREGKQRSQHGATKPARREREN